MGRTTLLLSAALAAGATSRAAWAGPTFQLVAQEFVDGVPWLKSGVPIPISEDGRVVFATESYVTFEDQLHSYVAGTLTPIPLTPGGYDNVNSIALNSAGNVAFVADRTSGPSTYRGVYRTTTADAAAISTYHEDLQTPDNDPAARFVAMSDNGTTAFSTIVSATGAIYRGDITGSPSVVRSGTGTFFNTQRLDVNDAGSVAVQMEHTSPVMGLSRGIIQFDDPNPTLSETTTAIEQTSVAIQPMPSINGAGQIAFSLNTAVTMKFYATPNVIGPDFDQITLAPGVYVTEAAPYGQLPRSYTQIANNLGAYDLFGDVVINDLGQVIFEASLDGPDADGGLFFCADPVAHKLIQQGDELEDGRTISVIALGDLNNVGQFTFQTSWFGGDRQVWVGTIPEPGSLAVLGLAGLVLRRRARA